MIAEAGSMSGTTDIGLSNVMLDQSVAEDTLANPTPSQQSQQESYQPDNFSLQAYIHD